MHVINRRRWPLTVSAWMRKIFSNRISTTINFAVKRMYKSLSSPTIRNEQAADVLEMRRYSNANLYERYVLFGDPE